MTVRLAALIAATAGRSEPRVVDLGVSGAGGSAPWLHVLFLNTRDMLGADVAVHISLARTLGAQGVRVSVATGVYEAPGDSARAAFASIPDLRLLTLELGRPLSGKGRSQRVASTAHSARGAVSLLPLAWWCRRNRVNVIHVTERPRDAFFGWLLARLAGARCLVQAHTGYYRHDSSRLSDWALRRVDAVAGVSLFTANTYVEGGMVQPTRAFAVHNAVDASIFRPDVPEAERMAVRARLGVPFNRPLIGCAARLSRWKDQESLVEALAAVRRTIPEAHVILAGYVADAAPDGQGDYGDYLRRRIETLGLGESITFAGVLPHRAMPAFYCILDVLAHPAVEEPFGLAIIEAMACARPVVAVRAGGVPEIIRHGTDGLLVPARDPASLAECVASILRDQAFASQLGMAARQRVSAAFTPQRQAAAMGAVYQQVVAGRSKSDRREGSSPIHISGGGTAKRLLEIE